MRKLRTGASQLLRNSFISIPDPVQAERGQNHLHGDSMFFLYLLASVFARRRHHQVQTAAGHGLIVLIRCILGNVPHFRRTHVLQNPKQFSIFTKRGQIADNIHASVLFLCHIQNTVNLVLNIYSRRNLSVRGSWIHMAEYKTHLRIPL